jgi:hypothetical protein
MSRTVSTLVGGHEQRLERRVGALPMKDKAIGIDLCDVERFVTMYVVVRIHCAEERKRAGVLHNRKQRFDDFVKVPEGFPPWVLSDWEKRLV